MHIYNIKINGGIVLKMIIVILSLFMLTVFGISIYKIFFASGKFLVNDKIKSKEVIEIQPENYTNILQAVHDEIDSYVGVKIKFTGYVYRIIDFKDNQFVLARDMYINKEKSQSVVVGFLCQYEKANTFESNTWVELTGIIEKGKYHNQDIPIIKVIDLQKASIPENAFVNPPNNTYIPTSGLL